MGDGATVAESRFLLAIEYADLETGVATHALEKVGGVRRIAYGARRDRLDPRSAELTCEGCHSLQRFDGAVHRLWREGALRLEPGTETRRRLHFVHDLNCSRVRDVGDDLPD